MEQSQRVVDSGVDVKDQRDQCGEPIPCRSPVAASSISAAAIVHLPIVLAGRTQWQQSETIRQAINIDQGTIQKPSILSFQNRRPDYPHSALNAMK